LNACHRCGTSLMHLMWPRSSHVSLLSMGSITPCYAPNPVMAQDLPRTTQRHAPDTRLPRAGHPTRDQHTTGAEPAQSLRPELGPHLGIAPWRAIGNPKRGKELARECPKGFKEGSTGSAKHTYVKRRRRIFSGMALSRRKHCTKRPDHGQNQH
jgi:hypothetical protein